MEVVALDDALRARDPGRRRRAVRRGAAHAGRGLPAARRRARTRRPTRSLERDLIFVGTVGIIDPPREEAAVAIREAHRAGIRVIMITGDHPRTAARIAADLGIVEAGAPALTGLELDALDDAAFAEAVRKTSVYARVAPAHKLRIVDALQADGNIVAMTGDGVNDAPALKSADIGVAMGVTGTEVTKEAAKMILADDNFATIVEAVREGRGIFDNIRKFLRYLLSSNMGEVLTVFLGVVGGRRDRADGRRRGGGAAAAGHADPVDQPDHRLRARAGDGRRPADRRRHGPQAAPADRARDRRAHVGGRDRRSALVMAVVTLLTIDLYLPGGLIEGTHDLDNARTAGFTVLVFAQLFNCFNARSETTSAFAAPVRQPVAVGRDRAVGAAAGGGGQRRLPQRRLRHGAARRSTSGWCAPRWPAWCCGSASCASCWVAA